MKLLEEQRERLQIDDIRTILCIALGEHSRLADDVTADLMHEICLLYTSDAADE